MFCSPSGYRADMSGTSMASPHLAGTVALVLAHGINNGGDTTTLADDVKAHLCSTASQGFGVNSTAIPPHRPALCEILRLRSGRRRQRADQQPTLGGRSATAAPATASPARQPPARGSRRLGHTQQGNAVNVNVLANDSDPDGDVLAVSSVTAPANGTAAVVGNAVRYTPAAGYNGSDSFSYTVSDGHGGTATANVDVTVTPPPPPPPNRPPVAVDDAATTPHDAPVVVNVLSNDSDPDGDSADDRFGVVTAQRRGRDCGHNGSLHACCGLLRPRRVQLHRLGRPWRHRDWERDRQRDPAAQHARRRHRRLYQQELGELVAPPARLRQNRRAEPCCRT